MIGLNIKFFMQKQWHINFISTQNNFFYNTLNVHMPTVKKTSAIFRLICKWILLCILKSPRPCILMTIHSLQPFALDSSHVLAILGNVLYFHTISFGPGCCDYYIESVRHGNDEFWTSASTPQWIVDHHTDMSAHRCTQAVQVNIYQQYKSTCIIWHVTLLVYRATWLCQLGRLTTGSL